ncbi:MAG TPA: KH domain-containing protein, partial [Candidatus Dojkabacteria bacterium]|nr:KH domain-containing protein [Candidatus Dojkabacteria bacterium]
VDPIGSCVGQRGIRIANVMNEVGEEKIDIIEWDEDDEKFVANALSPAKIDNVVIEGDKAIVTVPEDQLSLAIGREGQNVRLACKLTGFKIDIISNGVKAEIDQEPESSDTKEKVVEKDNNSDNE